MKLPDTSMYTIIQLVMGAAMGIAGVALLAGIFWINYLPLQATIALCLLAIAGKYLADGLVQMMSAMSTNVEPEPEPIGSD